MQTKCFDMMMVVFWRIFVGVLLLVVQGYEGAQVEVEPREALVVPGHNVTVMCRVAVPLQYCRVVIPGMPPLNLNAKLANPDVSYYGQGLSAGHCGFTLNRVTDQNNGVVQCTLGIDTEAQESIGTMQLVVARMPEQPELTLSSGADSVRVYRVNDELQASCMVRNGRPVANISWYLDNEPLYRDGLSMASVFDLAKENLQTTVQNLTRILQPSDNGKHLKCVAHHPTYPLGEASIKKQLDVKFGPLPQPELDKFGYTIGKPGVIQVVIEANPKPQIEWDIGSERIKAGQDDQSGRITAEYVQDLGKGRYEVNLKIAAIQKHDTEKIFVLRAYNDMGGQDYNIKISTSPEPEGIDLGIGAIIGIVVAVLIALTIVFVLVFAKCTGRWCFSDAQDTRNLGETSDTESAEVAPRFPPIKLTSFFRRGAKPVAEGDGGGDAAGKAADPKEGVVYAELDLVSPAAPKPVVKSEEDKTEYAEIVYTPTETEQK